MPGPVTPFVQPQPQPQPQPDLSRLKSEGSERSETAPEPRAKRLSVQTQLLLGLLALGMLTRLCFLGRPAEVVFDEVHFGKFVTAYCCTHKRFFDLHPPHAKLLMAGAAHLLGFQGLEKFDRIGEPFRESAVPLRIMPALFGATLPAIVFLLFLQLGGTLALALLGGLAVALDNSLILESRIGVLDMILLSSQVFAVSACLGAVRCKGRSSLGLFLLGGALCGLSAGCKFSGLVAPALAWLIISVESFRHPARIPWRRAVELIALVSATALCVYLAGWRIHFWLLSQPGPGDAFYPTTGRFFTDLTVVHKVMLAKHLTLTATHPDASKWWSWPFIAKPIFYWIKRGASLYLVGNPVVWWGSTFLLLGFFWHSLMTRITDLRSPEPGAFKGRDLWIPLVAYAMAYLPLAPIPRVLFLYHYLTPLVFAEMTALLWLEGVGWTKRELGLRQNRRYWIAVGLVVLGFLWLSPVTYGFGMPGWYWKTFPWTFYH